MRKGITQGLFSIILVYTLASCAPPMGYVGGSSGFTSPVDDFWAVPRRQTYDEGSLFVKAEDLWVFASSMGVVQKIDINQVAIELEINPDDLDKPAQIVPIPPNGNGGFRLLKTVVGVGRKVVTVSYNGMLATYSITIDDLTGSNGNNGNGDDDGTFGGFIKWE